LHGSYWELDACVHATHGKKKKKRKCYVYNKEREKEKTT
jgi:hypothetical protein